MLKIVQLKTDEHRHHLRELLWEYLTCMYPRFERELNITWDVNNGVNKIISDLSKFAPPKGRFLLANYDSNLVGCAGLIKINDDIGELTRMYVKPSYQRKGIGRALFTAISSEARQIGYSKIVLDSPGFLKEAHAFYYSFGFQKIQPYSGTKVPEQYRPNWLFMEKILQN